MLNNAQSAEVQNNKQILFIIELEHNQIKFHFAASIVDFIFFLRRCYCVLRINTV